MGNRISDANVELPVSAQDRITALEKRVADLESKLARSPGEACPHCGALAMRLEFSERSRSLYARFGAREETWRCRECGRGQTQTVYPKGMPRW